MDGMRNRDLCGFCKKEILTTKADAVAAATAYRQVHPKAHSYRCPVLDCWHVTKDERRARRKGGKRR